MRQCRDTFLHFLADNLGAIPVHNVRRDLSNPGADRYQMNSVNVKFLDVSPSVHIAETLVEIAVINDDELTALAWLKSVFDLLSSAYETPKMDYTVPASPVATGTMIYWDTNLKFRYIANSNDFYFDYRCMLSLCHKVDS